MLQWTGEGGGGWVATHQNVKLDLEGRFLPMWNLTLQAVFNAKNEFYSIQSAYDLIHLPWHEHVFTVQSAALRYSEVEAGCGSFEGTSYCGGKGTLLTEVNFFPKSMFPENWEGQEKIFPDNILAELWNKSVRHSDSSKSRVVFLVSQVLYSQNRRRLSGSLVLQIPSCIFSFVCSALLLTLSVTEEAVKWLSKDTWKAGWYCISLFCPTFCRSTLLHCVYAWAAAFLGASCVSEHHSNWCFWYSLSCHFLSYWCCCTVSMKQWHCLDLQSP